MMSNDARHHLSEAHRRIAEAILSIREARLADPESIPHEELVEIAKLTNAALERLSRIAGRSASAHRGFTSGGQEQPWH